MKKTKYIQDRRKNDAYNDLILENLTNINDNMAVLAANVTRLKVEVAEVKQQRIGDNKVTNMKLMFITALIGGGSGILSSETVDFLKKLLPGG